MPTLSAVIPTWCERDVIASAVACAHAVADEVIVADGGSTDGTAELARDAGARVVRSARGRGLQLGAGAAEARGDILLFIHADARLPSTARAAIFDALDDEECVGGNFRLAFSPSSAVAQFVSSVGDLLRRGASVYYGDSGLFIRRRTYEALGGFPPLPLFEDYALVRRLEQAGRTRYLRHIQITASARRFHGAPVRTLMLWSSLQAMYFAGIPPSFLARMYKAVR